MALYKGLGAVLSGIVPKMAIRFASFEAYKGWLADKETGKTSLGNIFIGTLAIQLSTSRRLKVTPLGSWSWCRNDGSRRRRNTNGSGEDSVAGTTTLLADPLETPRYRNAAHAVYKIVERGRSDDALPWRVAHCDKAGDKPGSKLYGVPELKKALQRYQSDLPDLPSWQHMFIGLISGAAGPMSNAPIDTIKTRVSRLF